MIRYHIKDGSLIETVLYRGCEIENYWPYVNDDKDDYRLGNVDGSELREVMDLECVGYDVIVS